MRPLVIGTPIYEFEAKPSSWSVGAVFRPDTIVDGWATEHFVLRGASVRGYSHRWEGLPRQDDLAVAVHPDTGAVLVAVADGVASARLSHIGATWACHTAIGWLSDVLNDGTAVDDVDWSGLLTQAALALVQYTNEQLGGGPDGREAGLDLATTLVAGAVVPRGEGRATAFLVRAGDSGAWLLRDGAFSAMPGGKASGIGEIAESAVEYPLPSLSPSPPRPYVLELGTSDVLLIGTDGFGDPLGAGTGEVGRAFARHLASPPPPLAFARLLDFSRELYDDDRTLIAVWPQHLR